jgi:hypothetical protein
VNGLRETCHCGHHKDTHHFDPVKGPGDCLGMRCDCKGYRDDTKPDTFRAAKPDHPPKWNWRTREYDECQCYACKTGRT